MLARDKMKTSGADVLSSWKRRRKNYSAKGGGGVSLSDKKKPKKNNNNNNNRKAKFKLSSLLKRRIGWY